VRKNVVIYPVAIGLAACAVVLLVVMSLVPSSTNVSGVTISPSGSGLARITHSGPVLFYINNAEPFLVHLGHLEVQVVSTNGWKTVSEEWSSMLSPGGPTGQWAGALLAGSHRTCHVQPPLQGPWRVRLTYLRQNRGPYALFTRARVALARRSLFQWGRGNVFRLADQHQVVSQEFSQ
jgi:hypothetical protein